MFASAQQALRAYTSVHAETGVEAADAHGLVLMLFEGARIAVSEARRHMEAGRIAPKGRAISKAIAIINEGLRASLDLKAGGLLGERLAAIYAYLCERLLHANVHNQVETLAEVQRLLTELHDAWAAIGTIGKHGTSGTHTANAHQRPNTSS